MGEPVAKEIELVVANAPAGVTAQPEDTIDVWTLDDAIPPPANLDALAGLTQIARTRRSCIEAIVVNTVGRALTVKPREGHEDEVNPEDAATILATVDAFARRDTRLGRPTTKRLLSAAKWDEEEVGNGAIEISRNRVTGQIDGMFHVVGKRVRRRKDRKGWVVGSKTDINDRVDFYDFGDKVQYNDDGTPKAVLIANQGKRWERNELIVFQIYTSESRDYGLPRDANLALDYLGDKNAAETNVGFFDSNGVAPTVLFVTGEVTNADGKTATVKISDRTVRQITDTIGSGGGRRQRVAIVGLPPGATVEQKDLATMSERDMGFVEYRRDNRRATIGAFRISPIFVSDIEDTNYSTAQTERKLTKEQVFDPEQERWADILSDTILRDLGFEHWQFVFEGIPTEDEGETRQAANDSADRGVIQNGEYRKAQGFEPLPEAKDGQEAEPGEVEAGWNERLMAARSAGPVPLDPAAELEGILKAERDELDTDFMASVNDAIAQVRDGLDLEPSAVIVEKDGETITIKQLDPVGA